MTKKTITWTVIEDLVQEIYEQIQRQDPDIRYVYGVPRGGLIPAVMLSHKLGVPLVSTLENHSLIVDDISDSGKTLSIITSKAYGNVKKGEYWTATLFQRDNTIFYPDFVGKSIDYQDWIVYPWEYQTHIVEGMETLV